MTEHKRIDNSLAESPSVSDHGTDSDSIVIGGVRVITWACEREIEDRGSCATGNKEGGCRCRPGTQKETWLPIRS